MVVHPLQQRQCKDNLVMTTRDFTANVISASKVVPDGNFKDSKASGVWDINEALDLIKGGNWPNAANLSPAAFVDGLFQTHLYTGNGTAGRNIENGIDLTKGGLVWIKGRETGPGGGSQGTTHDYYDTERGVSQWLSGTNDYASTAQGSGNGITAFNSNGFTIGSGYNGSENINGEDTVAWTWREQPKFFDIVTYTGNGSTQDISHNLGSTPGMIWIKKTSATSEWFVWHRSVGNSHYLIRNTAAAKASYANWLNPTSTTISLQNDSTNNNSATYIAYFFAHNDDDGGFGEPGDQDIIKCGSFTGTSSGEVSVNLGFEPQFIIYKLANNTSSGDNDNWRMHDVMRGWNVNDRELLNPNTNAAESNLSNTGGYEIKPTATGFIHEGHAGSSGSDYIYMAIRRGGMQTPSAASSVFHVQQQSSGDTYSVGFPTDFAILARTGGYSINSMVGTRLNSGKYLVTSATDAEGSSGNAFIWDLQNSFDQNFSSSPEWVGWHWARARGYFDVVAYTGNATNGRELKHNLGVVPEMVWTKSRSQTKNWIVYHSALGNTNTLTLNTTGQADDESAGMQSTPTATSLFLNGGTSTNANNQTHIAYLFATVAGVSKVGSFTQSGATNVDCGFTGDTPSFLILKKTNSTGSWFTFDSTRGLVAGNDKVLYLNSTSAQSDDSDVADPYSGGFATTANLSDGDYIFYAIAATS